jgi:hypothetical protein
MAKALTCAEAGKKGGKARVANMTPKQLSMVGKKLARKRWEKYRKAKAQEKDAAA